MIADRPEPSYSEIGDKKSQLSSNTQQTSTGLVNPLYEDRSIYSQPSKLGKQKQKKSDISTNEIDNQIPDYSELPDLPPRAYSEHQTQTSTYYNY